MSDEKDAQVVLGGQGRRGGVGEAAQPSETPEGEPRDDRAGREAQDAMGLEILDSDPWHPTPSAEPLPYSSGYLLWLQRMQRQLWWMILLIVGLIVVAGCGLLLTIFFR